MRLTVSFGHMEAMPRMSETEFEKVRDRQRDLYCVPVEEVRSTLARTVGASDVASSDEADEVSTAGGWKPAEKPIGARPVAD